MTTPETATTSAAPAPAAVAPPGKAKAKAKSKAHYRTGDRMTIDEFLSLGETDGKWELDDGMLYIAESASKDHQYLMHWFRRYIEDCLWAVHPPLGEVHHEMTTILSRARHRAPEPDLVVVLAGRSDVTGIIHVEGVPDIVVEILSTDRRRDLTRKRDLYADSGVPEYWIVDPRDDTVTQLELQDARYIRRAVLNADATLTTPLLPELSIPLSRIFQHPYRPERGE